MGIKGLVGAFLRARMTRYCHCAHLVHCGQGPYQLILMFIDRVLGAPGGSEDPGSSIRPAEVFLRKTLNSNQLWGSCSVAGEIGSQCY